MGKSLRSKSQQKNKKAKRASFFGDIDKERTLRIAEKLHGAAELAALKARLDSVGEDSMVDAEQAQEPTKKISTSGWSKKAKKGSKRTKKTKSKKSKR